ncbi:MAG: xanthine dehydrogenase family protein subunit M [Bacteroidia bacterium]|nr:xanthine dehydrogenase family protein subunit M [Bacteroidia bacterium]
MIPSSLEYKRASSIDEALSMVNAGAKILAGGHSLIPALKLRLDAPGTVVDISKISELRYIKDNGDHIAIGAASTHHDIMSSSAIQSKCAMMSQTAAVIGDVQVRNMGTIGGSIAHADPAADWPASLLAADAVIEIRSSSGSRSVGAGDFFQGLYMTALEEGEIITEIRIPVVAGASSAYTKFMQPASRFAIVGCAVMLTRSGDSITKASVAFTGVSDKAFRDAAAEAALNSVSDVDAASQAAAEGVDILSDHFASEEYRKHLAKVYAKRAMLAALG